MLDQVNAPSAVVSPDAQPERALEVLDDALRAAKRAGDVDADDHLVAPVGVLEVHGVEGGDRLDLARSVTWRMPATSLIASGVI